MAHAAAGAVDEGHLPRRCQAHEMPIQLCPVGCVGREEGPTPLPSPMSDVRPLHDLEAEGNGMRTTPTTSLFAGEGKFCFAPCDDQQAGRECDCTRRIAAEVKEATRRALASFATDEAAS